jgi:hypothetical protein
LISDLFVEAERIKSRLRKCKTAADVATVADEERASVRAMAEASEDGKTMALQIANLKAYRLWQLR